MARIQGILNLLDNLERTKTLTKKQIENLQKWFAAMVEEMGGQSLRECSKKQICAVLKIDKGTLSNWEARGAPVKINSAGGSVYDPGDLLKWRIEYQKQLDKDDRSTQFESDMQREQLALARERRKKLEVDRERKLRNLIPSKQVLDIWRIVSQIIRVAIETEDSIADAVERATDEFNKKILEPMTDQDDLIYKKQ